MRISDVFVEDASTWERVFLTFDMDWCHDDVLNFTLDFLDEFDVGSTWFVTHETRVLDRMRSNPKIELGIHPNFTEFASAESGMSGPIETVERLTAITPEAKIVRAHSLASSSKLSLIFAELGFTHDSGVFIPSQNGERIRPWRHPSGLIQVPFCWADDVATYFSCEEPDETIRAANKSLSVFDFHPIHVFLNTPNMRLYEETREYHFQPMKLENYRFRGFGTSDRLRNVLLEMSK